jgi:hypothetical protein
MAAVEMIACGASHPDLAVETRVQLARSRGSATEVGDGCGRTMVWTVAYRCVDCGRWFHRDCIRKHFEKSQCHERTVTATLADLGTSLTEGFVRPVRAYAYPVDLGAQVVLGTFFYLWRFGRSLTERSPFDVLRATFANAERRT